MYVPIRRYGNFTWSTGAQHVLLLTITGDKFATYVPIRRYGDFNTLQLPVHPSAAPRDALGYFRVLKFPYRKSIASEKKNRSTLKTIEKKYNRRKTTLSTQDKEDKRETPL
jgi:hypothetical protein